MKKAAEDALYSGAPNLAVTAMWTIRYMKETAVCRQQDNQGAINQDSGGPAQQPEPARSNVPLQILTMQRHPSQDNLPLDVEHETPEPPPPAYFPWRIEPSSRPSPKPTMP
ncbi:Hypothetical predicted protein [Lecanosticta acicola]|uniref:Uncharacterized protein n=1 Tax=Lecanosticta acicola TaxID=111012 RepID=A0AAI8Z545_9PEZI|nr:Hypothetical predicted protein [Lecanosticta acicola]